MSRRTTHSALGEVNAVCGHSHDVLVSPRFSTRRVNEKEAQNLGLNVPDDNSKTLRSLGNPKGILSVC